MAAFIDMANKKGYIPNNIRWASKKDQARNRKTTVWLTIKGKTLCIVDWARLVGVSASSIGKRVRNGLSPIESVYWKVGL